MKEFMKITGVVVGLICLVVTVTFGIRYFIQPKSTEIKNSPRQELIKELETNKKIVVFEFEKFTDTIEQEQEILELFIDDGLDRNYIIKAIEIVEGYLVKDRIILIFENGY